MTPGPSPEVAAVRPGEELEWERLATYLRANVEGLGPLGSASQFPNGSANLTYLIRFGAPRWCCAGRRSARSLRAPMT